MQSRAAQVHAEPTESADDDGARHVALELLVDVDPAPAPPAPKLLYGTVEPGPTEEGTELRVTTAEGTRRALRAKSCLVDAEPGDRVLCSTDGDVVYILAVITGGEATTIKAAGKLEIAADELKVKARSALLSLDDLRILGRSVEASFGGKAAIVAERIESRASRLLQRAKHAYRFIEGLDQVRAGNIDARAEGLAALRGENTIVSARVLAKIDGAQVKIG
jgi:hypothetical protein